MDYRRALRSLEPSSEHGVGGVDGERVWIELFANPLDLLGVLGMLGVGENSHEMLIAPRTAAVLGRQGHSVLITGFQERAADRS